MAFQGTVEVFLHLHSLRNIDLFHQGNYQVRVHAYRQLGKSEAIVSAVPVALTISPLECFDPAMRADDTHLLARAYINDTTRTFSSRTFQIRYCDEEVELNEGVVFQVEVDLTDPVQLSAPIYLEADLLYAENGADSGNLQHQQTAEQSIANEVSNNRRVCISSELVLTSAAYQIFQIQNPVQGVADYFPMLFDHLHCCVVHCTLSAGLVDIRNTTRTYPVAPVLEPRLLVPKPPPGLACNPKVSERVLLGGCVEVASIPNEGVANRLPREIPLRPPVISLIDHMAEASKTLELDAPVRTRTRRGSISPLEPSRVAPFSLRLPVPRDAADAGSILLRRCELVYHEYLTMLLRTYFRMRTHLATLSYRCLSESESETLDWLKAQNFLRLPGGHTIPCQLNGLPEPMPASSLSSEFVRCAFSVPAHLCADVADTLFSGTESESTVVAGATRIVSVPYLPLGPRLPNKAALTTMLQHLLSEDFNLLWSQIYELSTKLRVLMLIAHKETQFLHQVIWEKRIAARCREVTFLEVLAARSAAVPVDNNLGMAHAQLAEELRLSKRLDELPTLPIEDLHGGFDTFNHPILFEERYSESSRPTNGNGFVEKRGRLSSVFGGLHYAVPEGTTRALHRQGFLPKVQVPEDEAVATYRSRVASTQSTSDQPFEGLKALAIMTGGSVPDPVPISATPVLGRSPVSSSTADDSSEDSLSMGTPIDEDAPLAEENVALLKLNCPVFEEIPNAPKLYEGGHLIVLVHGFQGNSMDMRMLRNQLSLVFPEAMYLSSSANEEKTEGEISAMGLRLSEEVATYIRDMCPAGSVGRVSFITHSLGGLIARAALPHLMDFSSKFHTFLSLSSPHLGYIFARNRLVDAGLWVLKKWKKSASLQQLSMGDAKHQRDTLLYKLSQYPQLRHFRHVVFVSSFQDQYVPYESARVEISQRIKSDPVWGPVHTEMVRNMISNINKQALTRLDVAFKINDKSIDSLIGRTAHIQFLGSQQLSLLLVHTYPYWFA